MSLKPSDHLTVLFSKISVPRSQKKHLHAHLYSQFCCLTRMRAISGNCQYRMNERRTHTLFFCQENRICFYKTRPPLRTQCSYK